MNDSAEVDKTRLEKSEIPVDRSRLFKCSGAGRSQAREMRSKKNHTECASRKASECGAEGYERLSMENKRYEMPLTNSVDNNMH
jgi:hypothetical protein